MEIGDVELQQVAYAPFCKVNVGFIVYKLIAVPVARVDEAVHVETCRERSYDVVRLYSFFFKYGDGHCRKQAFERFDLRRELGRHGLACSFVAFVHVMPESGRFEIEGHRHVFGLDVAYNFQHEFDKAEYGVCRLTVFGCEYGRRVKSAVQKAVAVN